MNRYREAASLKDGVGCAVWRAGPRTAWAAVIAAALISLCGCVESPTIAHAAPRGNEGGAVVNVGNNLPGHLAIFGITVRRIADASNRDATCYALRSSRRGEASTAALGGALPAGTYEFPSVASGGFASGACDGGGGPGSVFARFKVEAGKLTDLGVLERGSNPRSGTAYMVPMPSATSAGRDERLREQFPELATLPVATSNGWLPESLPLGWQAGQLYTLARSFGLDSPSEETNGGWIFGTRTGTVRAWMPGDTKETLMDTGHRFAILATVILPDGAWLVGGEESTLLRSSDRGATWHSVRGDLPFGIIEHAAAFGGDVVLTLLDANNVSIYRGTADGTAWKKVASFQTSFSFWNGLPGQVPQTAVVGDDYAVSLPSTHMGVYHVTSGTSDVMSMPGSVSTLVGGRDGVLRCTCLAVLVTAPYESRDRGKTWHGTSAGRFDSLPAMRDATHGVMVTRSSAADPPFFSYTDDGEHWQVASPAASKANYLYYARDGRTAYASDGGSMLLSTHDDGRHWARAFTPGER